MHGFILTALSGCDIQRDLLYYPEQVTVAQVQQYASDHDLRLWPEENAAYRGIVSRNGPANFQGTIVIFHGNAGLSVFRTAYFTALEARGYRVVVVEYPGYGGRSGELSEDSFVEDARHTALLAKEEFGDPLYLWGESLGCGVASALATDRQLHPQGVVMLTPWDSLLNEARAKFPWLPVRFFLRDTYDNVANLANFKGSVAVIMAKRDEVIPNQLTERLYRELSSPKRMWTFDHAGHNDWPSAPGHGWWEEVMGFLRGQG